MTFYQGTENLPEFTDYRMNHRTYRYTDENVLYPFGYGLCYGKVSYSDLQVSKLESQTDEELLVSVRVKNESQYPLVEAGQIYIRHMDAKDYEPNYQLKAISSVQLAPGEEKKISVSLSARAFGIITEDGTCVVRPGTYQITAGGQQPDRRSEELTGNKVCKVTVTRCGKEVEIEY